MAQNLTELLEASNYPRDTQKEALAQAIKQALAPPSDITEAFAQVVLPQALQQLVPNATAALVAAAVAANQVPAVAEGFAMVNLSLCLNCVPAAYSKSEECCLSLVLSTLLRVLGAVTMDKCRHLQLFFNI